MKFIDSYELYRNGLHYDAQHVEIVEDIPFYISQAQKADGPILELACGTGRITIPIARQDFDITGLDISEGMLKVAREK
ncbi:MAG: class I SAM-dependent methyltransferase, partial [Candidatus Cloacimonetes bacterium]|nr:class I SAM-dependent methyltransferase [Candidatus Cloacimonadota bacterium]